MVLDEGKLMEFDTPENLLAKDDSLFASLGEFLGYITGLRFQNVVLLFQLVRNAAQAGSDVASLDEEVSEESSV